MLARLSLAARIVKMELLTTAEHCSALGATLDTMLTQQIFAPLCQVYMLTAPREPIVQESSLATLALMATT